jgi:hypothetical protein
MPSPFFNALAATELSQGKGRHLPAVYPYYFQLLIL